MFLTCQLSVYWIRARVNQISGKSARKLWFLQLEAIAFEVSKWMGESEKLVTCLRFMDTRPLQSAKHVGLLDHCFFLRPHNPFCIDIGKSLSRDFFGPCTDSRVLVFLSLPDSFFFHTRKYVKVLDDRQEDTWPAWQRPTWPTLWLLPRSGACLKWQEKPNQRSFLWMRPVESCFGCVTWRLKHLHVIQASEVDFCKVGCGMLQTFDFGVVFFCCRLQPHMECILNTIPLT